MVWFRVDDSLPDHPKLLALQERKGWQGALSLWTLAGSWCGKHLTDGAVPRAVVARLGCTAKDAAALVAVGLWELSDDGYRFHSWHKRNPTKVQVELDREKTRNRVTAHRGNTKLGITRNADCNGVTPPVTNGSGNGAPVPTRPDPTEEEESSAAVELDQSEPDHLAAARASRWLTEITTVPWSINGKLRAALLELARKPAAELAAADRVLRSSAWVAKNKKAITPAHVLDNWRFYGAGEEPGRRIAPESTGPASPAHVEWRPE